MNPQQVLDAGQQGLMLMLLVSAPILIVVLVVGLVVSIFQAATQINEATLSFVPKIVAAAAVLAVAGPWMMSTLVEYLRACTVGRHAGSQEKKTDIAMFHFSTFFKPHYILSKYYLMGSAFVQGKKAPAENPVSDGAPVDCGCIAAPPALPTGKR